MFNFTANVLDKLSKREGDFAPRVQPNALGEAFGPAREKEKVAAVE